MKWVVGATVVLLVFGCSFHSVSAAPGTDDAIPVPTSGCYVVSPVRWPKSAPELFEPPGATLHSIELCNGGTYYVFKASFKFDPQGQTSSYFHPFYIRLVRAINYNSFEVDDAKHKVAVKIDIDTEHRISIHYQTMDQ